MVTLAQFQNALAADDVPVVSALDAKVVRDSAGKPVVLAGNNALVARLRRTDGHDIALRILASPDKGSDWAVRYSALAAFQREVQSSRIPRDIDVLRGVGSSVADRGGGGPKAISVEMEWIAGPTLAQAADRAARAGNSSVLKALSTAFVRLWNDMVGLELVHADLTPANIIVRSNGQLVLVDFDDASWANAPFAPSGDGTPGYRHPNHGRQADIRDPFGALVILSSLAALADDPDIRTGRGRRVDDPDGILLFSPWDLANAHTSRGVHEALRRVKPQSAALIQGLVTACTGTFDDVLGALSAVPGLRLPLSYQPTDPERGDGWSLPPSVARIRAHYSDTWSQEDDATSSRDAVPMRRERTGLTAEAWPSWSTTEQEQAPSVTAGDIEELKAAITRNDEAEVIRIWSAVSDDPIAALLAADVEGVLATSYDRRVLEEARHQRDAGVIALGNEAAARNIPLGPRARTTVRQARERVEVQARLDQALMTNDRDELARLAVSGQLVVLGDTDRASLERVIQAIEWPVLERAIAADDDVLIDAAFDDELFGPGASVPEDVRERVELARVRLRWLSDVRDALAKRQTERLGELFIAPPDGAADRLGTGERRRIRRHIEQAQAVAHLGRELERGDEAGIVSALNRVERVSARISDRATWKAIQQVVERVTLIDDLLDAAQENPPDYGRLAQLLPAIHALGLEQDPRLGRSDFVAGLEQQLVRMAHVRRIQAAIARDNDIAIVTSAVPDPHNATDLLTEAERDRVAAAIKARRETARSLSARGMGPDS